MTSGAIYNHKTSYSSEPEAAIGKTAAIPIVFVGYTPAIAAMDSGLRICVERDLPGAFLAVCRDQDIPAAQTRRLRNLRMYWRSEGAPAGPKRKGNW